MKTNNVDFGKSFKFKQKNEVGTTVYTYHKPIMVGESAKVTWYSTNSNYEDSYAMYSVEDVERLVREGYWIVLPSETTDNSHNTENTSEDNLLDEIKAFTATSNHSVFIHEGKFEVYQAGLTEFPYKCKDDETLRSVMQALSVLDSVLVDEVMNNEDKA